MNQSEESLDALYNTIYEYALKMDNFALLNRLMHRKDLLERMHMVDAPPLITEWQEVMIAATTRVAVERGLL